MQDQMKPNTTTLGSTGSGFGEEEAPEVQLSVLGSDKRMVTVSGEQSLKDFLTSQGINGKGAKFTINGLPGELTTPIRAGDRVMVIGQINAGSELGY